MKILKRFFNPVSWNNLRTTKPISKVFGLDRGTPIDRYYIEKFINSNSVHIKGDVLEIGDNVYTKKFASPLAASHVLHYSNDNPKATMVGDLTDRQTLRKSFVDCFICTQTLNFTYDIKKAVEGAYYVLKPGGVLLITLAGLCQISRYDMDRWGDFWRFTTLSASRLFSEVFGEHNIQVQSYGNVLSSVALLHGISVEELTQKELDVNDPDYQLVITVIAKKC